MANEQGLAVRRQLTSDVFQMVQSVAPVMHLSRLFGTNSPEQSAAVMIKGFELGLPLAASFEFIHIIDGKPSLSPKGALALIYASTELAGLKIEEFDQGCTVWMKRKNGVEYTTTWTIDDAKKAGLFKAAGNWEKYGPNMCRWRAIGFCSDIVFPDVIGGLKRADELGAAIDDSGNVIVEAEWKHVPVTQVEVPASPKTDAPTLDELVERHGAEAVMVAAEGRIPGTSEELAAVATKLAA